MTQWLELVLLQECRLVCWLLFQWLELVLLFQWLQLVLLFQWLQLVLLFQWLQLVLLFQCRLVCCLLFPPLPPFTDSNKKPACYLLV